MQLSLKDRLSGSNRLVVLGIALALLVLYGFSIGDYFAKAPSAEISREVEVADVEWKYSSNLRTRVVTLPSPDGETATIVAVDGARTRMMEIDVRGDLLADLTLDIDLSGSRHISGYHLDSDTIVLFYNQGTLHSLEINKSSGDYRLDLIDDDVESFVRAGTSLIVEKSDGLYGWYPGTASPLRQIAAGPVLYYEAEAASDGFRVVTVTAIPGDRFDLRMIRTNLSLEVVGEVVILENSADDYYRKLQAMQIQDNRLAMLFVSRDDRFGRNYLTVRRINVDTGELIDVSQTYVPILNSRFAFVESDPHSSSFLMRYRTAYGYNLVKCSLAPDRDPVYEPLTKTRALSIHSAYFDVDGHRSLVFSDISGERRSILYASSHPDVVRQTTRWTTAIFGRALAVTLITTVMALFLGAIYLFFSSIVPFLAVGGLHRLLKTSRFKNYVLVGVGAILYTAIKFAVTMFVIRRTPNYQFPAPLFGAEPYIYLAILATSFLSFGLVARFLPSTIEPERPVSGTFFQFVLMDSIQYSLIFLIYAVTTLLIYKI